MVFAEGLLEPRHPGEILPAMHNSTNIKKMKQLGWIQLFSLDISIKKDLHLQNHKMTTNQNFFSQKKKDKLNEQIILGGEGGGVCVGDYSLMYMSTQ